jgi:hypothetical protein
MTKETFSLERALAEWRQQLRGAGVEEPARLDELENHLREDVERQIKSGTDAKPAFEIAAKRIGPATALGAEFSKVEITIPNWEQRMMRIYCVAFPIFYLCLAGRGLLKLEMNFAERAGGFLAVGLTCILILGTPYYHRFLPVVSNRRVRLGVQIAGVFFWMICAGVAMNFVLPQFNLAVGQIVVVVLWIMMPTAAFGGIGYGLGEAARRRIAMHAN